MVSGDINRKVSVILAADVVGYSKHMEENENETVKSLRRCETILRNLLKKHEGNLFNTGGDSFLIEFPSAVGAVLCAVNFQKEIKINNEKPDVIIPLAFRIGINSGDVVKQGKNYLGDGVNIAARLEALSQKGGVTISKNIYDYVKGKTEFKYNDLGVQKVKQNEFHAFDILIDSSHRRKLRSKKSPLPIIVFCTLILAIIISAITYLQIYKKDQNIFYTESNLPVILIMPFKNLTNSASENFNLGDAITEGISAMLQKYNSTVLLSSSTGYFIKDSNFTNKEIFDKYGVNFLINGSAQRVGSQIRVTTELLELETERVLWTERFDFLENEFFKMQDKISLEIVEALDVGPTMENSVITSSNFKNFDDYILQQSMIRYLRQASKEGWYKANSLYEKLLLSEAPEANKALMGGYLHLVKLLSGLSEDKQEDVKKIIQLSDTALSLQKDHNTHTLKAIIEANITRNCEAALYHSEQVEKLNPSARSINIVGVAQVTCGKYDSGIKNLSKALSLIRNDTDYNITKNLMMSYMLTGKYEEVVQIGNLTLQDKAPEIYILMAYAENKLGNERNAKKLINQQNRFSNSLNTETLKVRLSSIARAHGQYFEQVYSELAALGLN